MPGGLSEPLLYLFICFFSLLDHELLGSNKGAGMGLGGVVAVSSGGLHSPETGSQVAIEELLYF